jgi:predicted alpha/beta-fold hydrolase
MSTAVPASLLIACAAFAGGCASFQLAPYPQMAHEAAERSRKLQACLPSEVQRNRAAMQPCRSQAEIKQRLETLWQPSLRPSAWLNYSGLLATRYSKLNTQPGPLFMPSELVVEHRAAPTRVRYIAAFHPGRRLPLVVGSSGINGTVDGKITVDMLQSLYDTGQFHVVHLESLTSVNHQVRNQQPYLGGFPEGVLLYQTVAALRERSEFADQIEQVHLLGVSFGGLLCGVAAHCEDTFQAGVIDGAVLALSPPLDLRILFDNLAVNGIVYDSVQKGYVEDGVKRYFQFGDFGVSHHEFHEMNFDSYMRRLAYPQFVKASPAVKIDYPDLPHVNSPDDLYAISSLRPLLGSLGVPYMMVFAYDDPVVSPEDHFRRVLAECPNPLVDGILLEDGGHLGFDTVAASPFTSQVAVEYFRYWSAPRMR